MNKKKRNIGIGLGICVLIGVWYGVKEGGFGRGNTQNEVTVIPIAKMDITETVVATGKIQPEVEVKLSSEVSGEIIELPVKEGDYVEKGALLVAINPDIIQSGLNRSQAALETVRASLTQAEASLKEAQFTYDRNQGLFDKGIISKAEWDKSVVALEVAQAGKVSAYHNVRSAQATVSEAQDNLNRTTIYAPMSGTISKLAVELGERVVGTQQMAGTEILRVADLSTMEVEVDVNENDIVKVTVGDTALVAVDACLKKEFKGVVTAIANSAEEVLSTDQVTNFKVKVRILKTSYQDLMNGKPTSDSPFRPGMTATVDLMTETQQQIIGVPISAIVMKSDSLHTAKKKERNAKKKEHVFVKEGSVAKLRMVKTGIQDDQYIQILEGVSVGDEVISGPYQMVTKTLLNGDVVVLKQEN